MRDLERYVGQTLDGKYHLERLLGQGGMGAVYLATHLGTERFVALKLIAPEFMRNDEFVERFKREARAAGRLRHPNVVDVTDFGFAQTGADRLAYLVMEYLDGCTLGDVLSEEKRLPLEFVVDILEQVSSAVHEAHQQGIVHRDLKPDNIWLEPNRLGSYQVKVLDFGIAKLAEANKGTAGSATTLTSGEFAFGKMRSISVDGPAQSTPHSTNADSTRPVTASTAKLEADTIMFGSNHGLTKGDGKLLADESQPTLISSSPGAEPFAPDRTGEEDQTQLFASRAKLDSAAAESEASMGPSGSNELASTKLYDQQTAGPPAHPTAEPRTTAVTEGLTRVGAIMGTPVYMSPEQCRGEHLDARADIYSLGVIAYQMLGGAPPFAGDMATVMRLHIETAPRPLREHARKLPKRVARVVMSALAKEPSARPQSAQAFANSLRANADGLGALYRRAFSLYSEYFPKFLKLSLIAHIPVIFFSLLLIALELINNSLQPKAMSSRIAIGCLAAVLVLGQAISYFLAASAISGMTAVIVTQLSAAPLRPVELRTAFALLKRRWRPFLNTSIRMTVRILLFSLLGGIPGLVVSIRYALYAPVVLMEGLTKKAARLRARELGARSWKIVITVLLLQLIIPIIVSAALGQFSMSTHKPSEGVSVKISHHLSGLFNIVIIPFMSIVPALLYLKMRQLGGETLSEAIAQIEEVEAARSSWQQRMRTRLTVHTPVKITGGSARKVNQ